MTMMRWALRKEPSDSETHRNGIPGSRHFKNVAVSVTTAGGWPIASSSGSACSHSAATAAEKRAHTRGDWNHIIGKRYKIETVNPC